MPIINFNLKKETKVSTPTVRKGHHTYYGTFSKYGNKQAVYGIKCVDTNKIYIGSTKCIQRRLIKHFSELHLNRHRTKEMQKDYNTYGKNSFEIIIYTTEKCELLKVEKEKQLEIGIDHLYNEKISGVWVKDEYRKQLASANKSTHKTKEYRDKMSNMKTNKIAQYYLDGELIKIWDSAIQICETLGHTRSVILSCCNGSKPKAYGYLWRYVDDYGNIISNGYAKARKKV